MSEYTHNDDVAEIIYSKDREIQDLEAQVASLEKRLEYIRTELDRLEKDYARGF